MQRWSEGEEPFSTSTFAAALRPSSSPSPSPSSSTNGDEDDAASLAGSPLLVEELNGRRIVIERASDYLSSSSSSSEEEEEAENGNEGERNPPRPPPSPLALLSRSLRRRAEAALLPRGYPASVTPDYLEYQLASLPVHVTGWVSSSLATSALLAAATTAASSISSSSSSSPSSASAAAATAVAATAASSAAVKWVAKDGLGAAGRLLTGSKLGTRIDDDPRRWRLVGEALTTLALALDIATPLAASWWGVPFLAVAGAAAFASAAAKGVARPAARVIQTHFASRVGNVGDVSAKEEVWEVLGQVVGLACGVVVLDALLFGGSGSGSGNTNESLSAALSVTAAEVAATNTASTVAAAWFFFQGLHVFLRVRALRTLRFDSLNHKRGCIVASAFVRRRRLGGGEREGEGREQKGDDDGEEEGSEAKKAKTKKTPPLPTPEEAAALEPLLVSSLGVTPRVSIGATVEEAFPRSSPSSSFGSRGFGSELASSSSNSSTSSSFSTSSSTPPPPTLRESLAAHGSGAKHALSWQNGQGRAVLLKGAEPRDALAVLLQCCFLEDRSIEDASVEDLRSSWQWTLENFPVFLEEIEGSGWVSGAGAGLLAGAARLGGGSGSGGGGNRGGGEEEEEEKKERAAATSASFEE